MSDDPGHKTTIEIFIFVQETNVMSDDPGYEADTKAANNQIA